MKTANASSETVNFAFRKTVLIDKNKYNIHTVEYKGDGVADLFLWYDKSKQYKIISAFTNTVTVIPLNDIYDGTVNATENWDRVEFADFNGDGLTDIMNLHEDGYILYYSNGTIEMSKPAAGTWMDKYHDLRFGDFNGDGKSDIFLSGWEKDPNTDGWANWNMRFSKGDGTFERFDFARLFKAKDKQIFVTDINGDGYDDFFAIDRKSTGSNMTTPDVWLNEGMGRVYKQTRGDNIYALDKWRYYFGDFNGDGKVDFLSTANWQSTTWDGYQLFLMPEDKNNLLSEITDGMGNTTTVDYKYLSDRNVYERRYEKKYPLSSIGSSWPVVSSVSVPDGIGGKAKVTYKYNNALLHRRGHGVLGFETVTISDELTETKTVNQYEVNTDEYVISLKQSQTFLKDKLVAEKDVESTLLRTHAKVYALLPKITKETTYEYNSGTILSEVKTTMNYDNYGNVTTMVTDNNGEITTNRNTYFNDKDKWLLGRMTESVVTRSHNGKSVTRKSNFEYSSETGLLMSEHTEPDNNQFGVKKEYVRDAFGNIIESKTIPNDGSTPRKEKTSYDSRGQYISSMTNTLGFTTTMTVDEALGVELTSCDANGQQTVSTYDEFGQLQTVTTPLTSSRSCTGWSSGMSEAPVNALYFTYTDATGEPYSLEFFDCLGRSLRKVGVTAFDKVVYSDIVYNAKGQVEKTSEPYFPGESIYWNHNYYDDAGRIIRQVSADGSGNTVTYNGFSTTTTDALGRNTVKSINKSGLLSYCQDIGGNAIEYDYDLDGNCIEINGGGKTILMEYDIMGHRIRLEDYEIGVVEDTYNGYGECVSHKDGKGTTKYRYDAGGRLKLEERADGNIEYYYDSPWKGAVSSIYGHEATRSYYYDEYGRVVKVYDYYGAVSYYTKTTYNELDKPDVITYPSGLQVKNIYNKYGVLMKVASADSSIVYWERKAMNARMQTEEELLGNGLTVNTGYDASTGRIASIEVPGIQNMQYNWDYVGNLISRADIGKGLSEQFVYNNFNCLTEVWRDGVLVQSMTYDGLGNIQTKSDVGRFNYNTGKNQLVNVLEPVCRLKDWSGMEYTSFHKLRKMKVDNAQNLEFKYGVDKSRIRMARLDNDEYRPTILECRYYVGKIYEEERKGSDITQFNYIFVDGKAVAMNISRGSAAAEVVYLHHDHLGSVMAYSDSDGRLVQELSYDAWGRRRNPDTWNYFSSETDAEAYDVHGFTGHEHIDALEMINMDGRIYDPIVGRFLSPDPLIQNQEFSLSFNRYIYCLNNPLSLVDPTGYSWISRHWKSLVSSAIGIAVGAITGGAAAGVTAAIIGGAAGGAAGALTGALLNGANIGQIAKATFTGAFWGGMSGILNFASAGQSLAESLVKHSMSQAWLEGAMGGNMFHGLTMGLISSSSSIISFNYLYNLGDYGSLAFSFVLGGTISELGGGKFSNGAISSSFSYLFNEMKHHFSDKQLKNIYIEYTKSKQLSVSQLCGVIGGELAPLEYMENLNGCAIRLSYAMNKAGFKIPNNEYTFKGEDGRYYFKLASKMADYLQMWYVRTVNDSGRVRNGLVFQHVSHIFPGVSGHVDVVFRKYWGSKYGAEFPQEAPYQDIRGKVKSDIFH